MVDRLSFDDFLNLPKQILLTAQEHDEYASLLSETFIHQYYQKKMKQEIYRSVEKFKDAKYFYSCDSDYSPSYSMDASLFRKKGEVADPVGNYVSHLVDDSWWVEQFYQCICKVACKLTMQEAIYFVDTFFGERSEEFISEKLGICRVTLQKIKKSCIVKLWLELKGL